MVETEQLCKELTSYKCDTTTTAHSMIEGLNVLVTAVENKTSILISVGLLPERLVLGSATLVVAKIRDLAMVPLSVDSTV